MWIHLGQGVMAFRVGFILSNLKVRPKRQVLSRTQDDLERNALVTGVLSGSECIRRCQFWGQ